MNFANPQSDPFYSPADHSPALPFLPPVHPQARLHDLTRLALRAWDLQQRGDPVLRVALERALNCQIVFEPVAIAPTQQPPNA
jgi:hypothetical protein